MVCLPQVTHRNQGFCWNACIDDVKDDNNLIYSTKILIVEIKLVIWTTAVGMWFILLALIYI